jgi:hypothetical protein
MSDGPHRSLRMRPGWKRLAERADNAAYGPEEVGNALIPALEEDCYAELPPEFIAQLGNACGEQDASLFKEDLAAQLEQLRGVAGTGIGLVILEYAIQLSERGEPASQAAMKATAAALLDRAARGNRQVEEHYCRKSNQPRALNVRARIEQGIATARPEIDKLAGQVLNFETGPSPRLPKFSGLDDGVRF